MRVYGGKRRSTRQQPAPDLVDQARSNLGTGADPCIITDALFDAAFRSLRSVATDHPKRWPMLIGYYHKLAALYDEAFTGQGSAGEGMIIPQRAPDDKLNMVSAPGLQYTPATTTERLKR